MISTGRHQFLLIRRLGLLLRTRMSEQRHLLQAVTNEYRGNCLPPRNGCGPSCIEAQELLALTESYMLTVKPKARPVVIGRIPQLTAPKRRSAMATLDMFSSEAM